MPAEHSNQPSLDTDEMYRDGCRVVLTADEAGIPLVKVSIEPFKSVVIWYHDDVVFSDVPDPETHEAMKAAKEEEQKSKPLKDQVMDAVAQRLATGDSTDPAIMAVDELDRLMAEGGT